MYLSESYLSNKDVSSQVKYDRIPEANGLTVFVDMPCHIQNIQHLKSKLTPNFEQVWKIPNYTITYVKRMSKLSIIR